MCFLECLCELTYLILTTALGVRIIIIISILQEGKRHRKLSTLKGHTANR